MFDLMQDKRLKEIKDNHHELDQLIDPDAVVHSASPHGQRAYLLYLIELLSNRLETVEKQREEVQKALELYANDMNWLTSVGGHLNIWHPTEDGTEIAAETLKRIKGDSQAEGHQSTESTQAQAGGRIGGSYE